jgi:hypothetical protein
VTEETEDSDSTENYLWFLRSADLSWNIS